VIPGVADELPGQKFPDHVHRFLEHLQALLRRRPLVTQDVLVKRLAGAHAKAELAAGQQRRRASRLGDDGRVHPHQRARHRRGDAQ
jgi:hypothetical protein